MARASWAWVALILCIECACSRSAQSYLQKGNQLYDSGKYADAEIEYRKSIVKDPKLAEGYYQLGLTELQLQKPGDALTDVQRAVTLNSSNEIYRVQLANLSLLMYQLNPSDRRLYDFVSQEGQHLLKMNPNSYDGLRLQADILMIDRKPEEALAIFQRIDTVEPYDPNVELPMVRILFSLHRADEAESLASRFLSHRKDFGPMYQLLLSYYQAANRPADAERLLRMQVANRPKDAKAWLELAAFYGDTHRDQQMSQTLDKILKDPHDFPEGPGMVGDLYAGGSRWEDALRAYRSGLNSDPKYRHLYEAKIANALIATGKRNEAVSQLGDILKAFPNDADARLKRAMLLGPSAQSKDLDLAIDDLKKIIQQNPMDEVAHYNLGIAYRASGDIESAQNELKKSIGIRGNYIAPYLALAEIALAQQNYGDAERLTNQVLSGDSGNFDARLLHATALAGDKQYMQARRELDTLSREHPDSPDVKLQMAALDTTEQKFQDAEGIYQRLYQPGSTDLRPFEGLLQLYIAEKQQDKAQRLLDSELQRTPNSAPVRSLLASTAMKEGKLDLARQQYEWVRSAEPNSLETYESLGALYEMQGKTKEAIQSYQKASELAPKDPRILGSIAILQTNSGATSDAIRTLEKELTLDPSNADAMNNLAYNLAQSGADLDRALHLAETAVRTSPNNPSYMDTLGWVYAKRGLNDSAIQVFRVLVKKYPKEKTYKDHLDAVVSHGGAHASL